MTGENTMYEEDGLIYRDETKKVVVGVANGFNSTEIIIPKTVETIEEEAFAGCQNLKTITFTGKVKSIKARAFAGCHNLEKVVFLNPDVTLEGCVFLNCSSLKGIDTLPEGSLHIWSNALGSGISEFYRNLTERKEYEIKTKDGKTIKFAMILVRGGRKMLGMTEEQEREPYRQYCDPCEITLSDFYIQETPVTQELWEAVMDENPVKKEDFLNPTSPVTNVSYEDCKNFITKLSELTGEKFTLPTVAQWEYAARGGEKSKSYKYAGSNDVDEVAWTWNNRCKIFKNLSNAEQVIYAQEGYPMTSVGIKMPNELGIYDMSGNVWEYCADFPQKSFTIDYPENDRINPRILRPAMHSDLAKVALKGGCINADPVDCQVSSQKSVSTHFADYCCGFRLAMDNREEEERAGRDYIAKNDLGMMEALRKQRDKRNKNALKE